MISIYLIAITLSIDAFWVGVAYGTQKNPIHLKSKIIMSIISFICACSSLYAGNAVSKILSPALSDIIGKAMLFLMGTWLILQAITTRKSKDSYEVEKNISTCPKVILNKTIKFLGITISIIKNSIAKNSNSENNSLTNKQSIFLGFALSIDAIGVSFGSALSGISSHLLPVLIGVFQFIFLSIGQFMGCKCMQKVNTSSLFFNILPGVVLISLATIRTIL